MHNRDDHHCCILTQSPCNHDHDGEMDLQSEDDPWVGEGFSTWDDQKQVGHTDDEENHHGEEIHRDAENHHEKNDEDDVGVTDGRRGLVSTKPREEYVPTSGC